jgi:SNARE domain./SNAP-25 family.
MWERGFCVIIGNRKYNFRFLLTLSHPFVPRSASFKEDEGTWKGNDDGKVVNNQPQRVMDDRNGLGPQAGYIGKITNDARENEMEENMGQVNTMIGNLRNMAIDMGSELENQNRQIDRINRKVKFRYRCRYVRKISDICLMNRELKLYRI